MLFGVGNGVVDVATIDCTGVALCDVVGSTALVGNAICIGNRSTAKGWLVNGCNGEVAAITGNSNVVAIVEVNLIT